MLKFVQIGNTIIMALNPQPYNPNRKGIIVTLDILHEKKELHKCLREAAALTNPRDVYEMSVKLLQILPKLKWLPEQIREYTDIMMFIEKWMFNPKLKNPLKCNLLECVLIMNTLLLNSKSAPIISYRLIIMFYQKCGLLGVKIIQKRAVKECMKWVQYSNIPSKATDCFLHCLNQWIKSDQIEYKVKRGIVTKILNSDLGPSSLIWSTQLFPIFKNDWGFLKEWSDWAYTLIEIGDQIGTIKTNLRKVNSEYYKYSYEDQWESAIKMTFNFLLFCKKKYKRIELDCLENTINAFKLLDEKKGTPKIPKLESAHMTQVLDISSQYNQSVQVEKIISLTANYKTKKTELNEILTAVMSNDSRQVISAQVMVIYIQKGFSMHRKSEKNVLKSALKEL